MTTLKKLSSISLLLLAAPILVAANPPAQHPGSLLYPLPPDGNERRYAFEFDLATQALRGSKQDAGKLTWAPQAMSLSRARVALEKGQLDLIHSFATDELDKRLTPVRFEADKGMNSWRVLVARCADLPALGQYKRMSDLSAQRFGLMASWSDRQSLQQLGYRVAPTQSMDALFAMLAMGRSDVILSGLLHIRFVREALTRYPNLCIEPNLAIQLDRGLRYYTSPTPEGKRLAQQMLSGLQAMDARGELDQMIRLHHGDVTSELKGRRRLKPEPAAGASTGSPQP